MARLIFLSDRFAGRVHDLRFERTRVGRGPGVDLAIDDKSVSHQHCEILVYGTEVIVRDHDSTNGCFVDGIRVQGQYPVRNGQVIGIGLVDARLELSPADEFDTEGASAQTASYLQTHWMKEATHAPTPQPPPAPPIADRTEVVEGTVSVPKSAAGPAPARADSPLPERNFAGASSGGWIWVIGLVLAGAVLGVLALWWLG